MNDEYSYVGVPSTTQELTAKEDHDHSIQPSETHTVEAPAAPKLNAPALEWTTLITPIGTLVLGAVLALGHHAFNAWEDGRPVAKGVVSQHWVTRIGVAFSFGFKSVVGATMAFVLLQCLWLAVVRQSLTIQQLDTMYQIERQDQLYKTLPRAVFFSPTIVIFSALTLLLPLSGVFAPGSLTVTTKNSSHVGPCMIPTGNFSTANTPDSASLYTTNGYNIGGIGLWNGVTPRATTLTTQWLVEQRIPDLPQACGPNCRYKVHVPSFVFQCTPNPSSLPDGQAGDLKSLTMATLWNGTIDPDSYWGFYIAWQSNGPNGTSGNAYCSSFQAQYDVEVQTKGGVQSVTTNITQVISPIPTPFDIATMWGNNNFLLQLASISYATQALFMGDAVLISSFLLRVSNTSSPLQDTRPPGQPSFLDIPVGSDASEPQFVWGDVLKGIEEMSYNVTAALLSLHLGTMSAECFFDHQDVVYRYSSVALWVPYGTALGVVLISFVISVIIMMKNNTGDITTSFSNTATLTRNLDEDVLAGAKLRLRTAEDGKLKYMLE